MRLYYLSRALGIFIFHISSFSYTKIYLTVRQHQLQIQAQQQAEVNLHTLEHNEHGSIKEKCYKHFYILQLYDSVLFTDVSLHYYSIIKTVKTVAPKSLTH